MRFSMTSAITAFWAFALALSVQAGGLLIWGASLTQRVRQLEDDAKLLKKLPEKLARVEERTSFLTTHIRDLCA
jgi:cell division protein FtsB